MQDKSPTTPALPEIVEIAGKMFAIETHNDLEGGPYYSCGILPLRRNRSDLIRDIELSQGPEWRR